MKIVVPVALALTLGLATSAPAQSSTPGLMQEGTPVVVVGVISSQPRDVGIAREQKMQVAIGPAKTDYTLHLKDAKLFGYHGEEVGKDHFSDKMWVRAEGTVMDDARRIKVNRLQVIGGNLEGVKRTSFYRPGFDHGYVMAAGQPATHPQLPEGTPVVVVGSISSQPKDLIRESKMQVAIGPDKRDYTLHLDGAQMWRANGEKLEDNDLVENMWVRAEGQVMNDPRRIKVTRLQAIGRDFPSLRLSQSFRVGHEWGYIMPHDGSMRTFAPSASSPPAQFTEGMPVVLVGVVSSQPRDVGFAREQKMQVAIGPDKTDYTLHLKDAGLFNYHGEEVGKDHFRDKMWIRAEGTVMDDSRRIKVTRVQVIGGNLQGVKQTSFYRPGFDHGYIQSVAGERMERR